MDRARTLRLAGTLTLIIGAAMAVIIYWVQARGAAIDAAGAEYTKAQEHQLKALMGPLAVAMSGWADALMSPAGEALMLAAFAAFISYMCFRHAKMAETE